MSSVVADKRALDFPVVVAVEGAVEVAPDSVVLLDFAAFAVLVDLDSVVVATTLVTGMYALLLSLPAKPDVISTSGI